MTEFAGIDNVLKEYRYSTLIASYNSEDTSRNVVVYDSLGKAICNSGNWLSSGRTSLDESMEAISDSALATDMQERTTHTLYPNREIEHGLDIWLMNGFIFSACCSAGDIFLSIKYSSAKDRIKNNSWSIVVSRTPTFKEGYEAFKEVMPVDEYIQTLTKQLSHPKNALGVDPKQLSELKELFNPS